ncbi:thiamine phosphate synthase [Hydrogenovibrio sp. 3SP14C1]|uniref:thiamine phosphate synthase n=1 Tax=Hydrogenovibrio sp. 3SP14C1 TaxID=3038774 RepID=UPI0024180F34|nr:thiamine phosphate synthase [Hydrogenovibrio sp. 3SP14C1]MDG4813291.1 thiamine phosphate synthase [Hydrogenovibrio sp. 3SP14C1]
MQFQTCHSPDKPLGIYPLVDRAEKLKPLFDAGITTAQIRVKDLDGQSLENELAQADRLAKSYQARLFINDFWEMALYLNSYGVHLGQEDVLQANLSALHQAGIRLGISTHTPEEIDSALTIQPSYIAIGPIFETQSKQLSYLTTGLINLQHWVETLNVPVVAIGGIQRHNLTDVIQAGANGIAMINGLNLPGYTTMESAQKLIDTFNEAYQTRALPYV